MGAWPLLTDERGRLQTLRTLDVLAEGRDERFDRITRMVTRILRVPIGMVGLLEEDLELVKSSVGWDAEAISRSESFCAHAIAEPRVFVVEDATRDARFRDFPSVAGPPYIRSYAGHPLTIAGRRVGVICALDRVPRSYSEGELAALVDLGYWAETEMRARDSQRLAWELDHLQRRTEMVLGGVAEGVIGTDSAGFITFANPASTELLDWSAQELLGQDAHTALHTDGHGGESHPARDCPIRDTLCHSRRHRLLRDDFWGRNGLPVPMDWSTGAVRDEQQIAGAVVVFEDVTRRVALERAKDDFISVVSHELRTPLTALRGSLGLLQAGLLGEGAGTDARRLVDMAHSNALRLGRLVDDILDLERSGRGAMPTVREEVDLHRLLDGAAAIVQGAASAAGVRLQVEAPEGSVWGDEHRLTQALTNLLGNAVRFSPPGETVSLRADCDQFGVRLSVTDQGPGIREELQSRVFERFWQVDSSDSRARGGTGLGLAITKSIVEAHSGWVYLDSTPGRGSTFTIALPRRGTHVPVDEERRSSGRPEGD